MRQVKQSQYERYIKLYNKEVTRLNKYGLKPTRNALSNQEFQLEVLTRRYNKQKYVTENIVKESTAPLTTSQEKTLLKNMFQSFTDRAGNTTTSFTDKGIDLLVELDLWDKYNKILEYKQEGRRLVASVQMIKDVNTKLKQLGKDSYEIADMIGEAFYGS